MVGCLSTTCAVRRALTWPGQRVCWRFRLADADTLRMYVRLHDFQEDDVDATCRAFQFDDRDNALHLLLNIYAGDYAAMNLMRNDGALQMFFSIFSNF